MGEAESTGRVVPPGEYLRQELERRGWTQAEFATILGRHPKAVNEIVVGKRSITPRTAQELSLALGTSAKYWLNLENEYQLSQLDPENESIAKRAELFDAAPVVEMTRRGWIEPTKDADELERRLLGFFGIGSLEEQPTLWPHSARKSTPYREVTWAQWAWLYRARQLARALQAEAFTDAHLERGLSQLRLCLHHVQEVRKVPEILASAGVRFVIVEPLSGIKVDGACFWLDKRSPVVAVSLRYDRVDWFWHTLMHEIGHVKARDGLTGEIQTVDVDLVGETPVYTEDRPASEKAADDFAAAFLVDQEQLKDFIVRVGPLYSQKRILGFANRLHVHPGVVVGQLQHLGEISFAHSRAMLERIRSILTGTALTDGWGSTPVITA